MNPEIIYLDYNATTPVDATVLKAMLPFFSEQFGNAASRTHAYGWYAEGAVNKAREQVAALIGAEPSEIVFTSGATEAINTALKGIYEVYKEKGRHIITVKTEHKAVLDTCDYLQYKGAELTLLDVDPEGLIDLTQLKNAFRPDTILVCVMAANNETGVIQDLEAIADLCHAHHALFFSDATQYVGKQRLDLSETRIDCLSLSAHKFYGPKGAGALYVRRKQPRVSLQPLLHGGGHEQGRRSGTLNVPGIVGLGAAAELAAGELWENNTEISRLRAYFEHQLLDIEGLRINGNTRSRLYNTSNLYIPNNGEGSLMKLLPQAAFSAGSACSSASQELSHVLKAMGLKEQEIKDSYRFSFGKYTNMEQIKTLTAAILALYA